MKLTLTSLAATVLAAPMADITPKELLTKVNIMYTKSNYSYLTVYK